jgi:hypothetical protein
MKDRGTFALLALFFAGLVGLWVADFTQVPTRGLRDRTDNRVLPELLDLKPDALRKLEILGGEQPLVFERRDGNRWQMTQPMDVAADPSKVETLAYNLKELARRPDTATIEGDAGKYGLAPPERLVKLWGEASDAPLATLEVGLVSLDRRYVRAEGTEGIEVVDARGLDLLRLPAIRWRDAELFRVPSFEVDSLRLTSGAKSLKLRRTRGAWHLTEPVRLPAAETKVDGLIADLGSLRVLDDARFVANDVKLDDLERYGLKTPSLIIEVAPGRIDRGRRPQILHVGKPVDSQDGQVYVRRDDQDDVVVVDRRILKGLRPEPNDFRSAKVADINPARVIHVAVEASDGSKIEAARRGNDWFIESPSPALGDRQAIQDFLKSLSQLETSTYLGPASLADSGVATPSITLKVWQAYEPRDRASIPSPDPKGDLALDLRIGRRDLARKSIYAQVAGDPTILALPDTANAFLPRNPLAFRDRQVLTADVDAIEQIRFASPFRKFTLNAPVLKVKGPDVGLNPPGWWLAEPANAPADAPSVGKLLRLLANLRADSLVTEVPGSLEKYGLSSPALTVQWTTLPTFSMIEKPSAVERSPGVLALDYHTLLIGSALPDRPNVRYAKLGTGPLVFTLGPEALVTLDAEWRDHRVLTFDPTRAREIRLEWPDRSLTLLPGSRPDPAGWTLGPDSDAPDFDTKLVFPMLKAASTLTTTRFFQYEGLIPVGTGLVPPLVTIRVGLEDGLPPRTLKLGGPASPGLRYASIEDGDQGAVFAVPQAPFASILKAPRHRGELPENVFAP